MVLLQGQRTRCLIPASGYYESQDTTDGKQPHYFRRMDGQAISFAGLWDEWTDRATGETLKSRAMTITDKDDETLVEPVRSTALT